MDKEYHTKQIEIGEKQEKKLLGFLNSPDYNRVKTEKTFRYPHNRIAYNELILNGSIEIAKMRWSYSGLMWNYVNEKYTSDEEYWIGANKLAMILFCDNQELYQIMYQNCKYQLSSKYNGQVWQRGMWQLACGDWIGLRDTRDFLDKKVDQPNSIFHNKEIYLNIYDGFLNNDKSFLEQQLYLLEKPAYRKTRVRHVSEEKYISIYTTALAKLAWMHGMEVEVDSTYVPKELLPFKPLEEYTIPYRFLRDYYRAQGLDWRYDPVYPELQDWDHDPENPNRKDNRTFLKKLFGR